MLKNRARARGPLFASYLRKTDMRPVFIALFLVAFPFILLAQPQHKDSTAGEPVIGEIENFEIKQPEDSNMVYTVAEQPPEFPGGTDSMMKYIFRNLEYPPEAKEAGIQGRVVIRFVVNKDGTLSDIYVVKSPHKSLETAAINVVKGMPKWKPGKQNGKTVRVQYMLPITFRLE